MVSLPVRRHAAEPRHFIFGDGARSGVEGHGGLIALGRAHTRLGKAMPSCSRSTVWEASDWVMQRRRISPCVGVGKVTSWDLMRASSSSTVRGELPRPTRCCHISTSTVVDHRLFEAIESGVADLSDPALKRRIDELKATRDQAQIDAQRATLALETAGPAMTPDIVHRFAETARRRIRRANGGYRRDHLRALAQRVEVADGEVRITGSRTELLRTLTAVNGVRSAANGVRSSVPTRRPKRDSNPSYRRERAK